MYRPAVGMVYIELYYQAICFNVSNQGPPNRIVSTYQVVCPRRRDVFSLRSPRGEKKSPHEASTRSLRIARCFLLPAIVEDSPREAGKTHTARYIPVWQLTAVAARAALALSPPASFARGFFPPHAEIVSPRGREFKA
ncbi:hypothetical protein BHE74_00056589, partial [Ensete ventricosum]